MKTVTPNKAKALIVSGTALPDGLHVDGSIYLTGCTGLTAPVITGAR